MFCFRTSMNMCCRFLHICTSIYIIFRFQFLSPYGRTISQHTFKPFRFCSQEKNDPDGDAEHEICQRLEETLNIVRSQDAFSMLLYDIFNYGIFAPHGVLDIH